MSMSFLAILISLAMMLTGVGGEGQPAAASRSLLVHNITVTYGDETVTLNPALRVGASTDGEKAVFDLGVDVNGDTLFPMQLGVDESGITALFEKSDVAVKLSAEALAALNEQLAALSESIANPGDDESAQIMSFIMNEYVPALTGMIKAMDNPDFADVLQEKAEAVFDEVIDRGEGTPVTENIDGTDYALTEYAYTIDGAQLAALADGIYTANDELNAFYEALFKLYDMMPEESGLNGMHSFADVFGKTGLDMTMDVVEKLSDDKSVDIMDGTITMDMSAMVAAAAQAEDGEAVEVPEIAPIVMNLHSAEVGDVKDANVTCDYAIDADGQNVALDISVNGHSVGTASMYMDMSTNIAVDGNDMGWMSMSANQDVDEETGDSTHAIAYTVNASPVYVSLLNSGNASADGTSSDNVMLVVDFNDQHVSLRFDLDVVADEITDNANGHEAALVLDDLSEETMNALGQDQSFQGTMMQALGSLMTDSQTLMADESVQQLIQLVTVVQPVEDYDYGDDSFEGEEYEEYEYEEPEDDGVLPYNEPQLTWLPEGWTLDSEDVDTAYDWVSLSYTNGEGYLYANFYQDEYNAETRYVVGEDGSIRPVEDREIGISSYDDDTVIVTLKEGDLFGNLNIYGADLDMETIGQIVAGIQF